MPRIARGISQSGIYHIMLRGANRQEIFHDEEDCVRFLETIDRYKKISKVKVYGWCLMGNHIHLLLEQGQEQISVTMKRIGVSYVWFYNWKYNISGHLFQGRYKSEKVENDQYLLSVVRYIHQNPIKAGMVTRADEWKWSSCQDYYGKETYPPFLLDREMILGMFSAEHDKAVRKFTEFNEAQNEEQYLEDFKRTRLTDEEARREINKLVTDCSIAEVKSLPKEQRDAIINKLKAIGGLSQRQTARILGISPNLVFKA